MEYVPLSKLFVCRKLTCVPITDLSAQEIVSCSKRFWAFQQDPVFASDPALTNILTCHVNLFIGTLVPLLPSRPYLTPLVEKALKAEIFGNLFLSELGYGLDIGNLETTATKVADGFVLNTPTNASTKYVYNDFSLPCFHAELGLSQIHGTNIAT